MSLNTYAKIFGFYLSLLTVTLAAFIFLLVKKVHEFDCANISSCLAFNLGVKDIHEIDNIDFDHSQQNQKLVKEEDKQISKEKKSNISQVVVIPESGTLIFYLKSSQFSVSFFNNQTMSIKVQLYLSDMPLDEAFEIGPGQKRIVPLKIHPYESKLSWKIVKDGNVQDSGYVEVLKMQSARLSEAIKAKQKMMVLE